MQIIKRINKEFTPVSRKKKKKVQYQPIKKSYKLSNVSVFENTHIGAKRVLNFIGGEEKK